MPVRADALTLTAVNDTLLPLSDETMPARLGGEMYVPYEVFSSLGVATSNEDGVLRMLSGGELLSFSTSEGYVYDQYNNSYSSPAYERNNTVYVPVKLCCGKFGLGFSTLSVLGETVLRITDSSARSDSDFAASNADAIENAINVYNGYYPSSVPNESVIPSDPPPEPEPVLPQPEPDDAIPEPPAEPEPTPEPEIPPVEESPAQKPELVYLTFFGSPNANTSGILDALRDSGRRATFFLPAEAPDKWSDDSLRRAAAEGHTFALLLDVEEASTAEALSVQAAGANAHLALVTGINTRIVSVKGGCRELTYSQRDMLTHAGYRLWDYTLDAGDDKNSAEMTYAATAQRFASTNSTVVLQLHHSDSTAQAIRELSSYISRQRISTALITFSSTPIHDT